MKRTIFVLFTIAALAMTTGCLRRHCRENNCSGGCPSEQCAPAHRCRLCGDRGCDRCQRAPQMADPGPATGAVAYPYYNLRGPRDFLDRNPQSIGP
jgi:hypothetical protein